MRVLCHGGGFDSVAAYIVLREEGKLPDAVVAADPGHEDARTYAVWDHLAKLCAEDGVRFATVRPPRPLLDKYERDRRLMLPHRGVKSCSTYSKRDPIRDWLKEQGVNNRKPAQATVLICYNTDEEHRKKPSDRRWVVNEFPLLERGIGRAQVEAIVQQKWNGPVVVKSGCLFCPQGGPAKLARLWHENRALFDRLRKLEETAKPGTGTLFRGFKLAEIARRCEQGRDPPREKDRPKQVEGQVDLYSCDGAVGCMT